MSLTTIRSGLTPVIGAMLLRRVGTSDLELGPTVIVSIDVPL